MAQLSGRRRNLGSDRWIDYVVFYSTSDDGQRVLYVSVLSDDVGQCPEAPSGVVALARDADAGETARAAICRFIDMVTVSPGLPHPDPSWALRHALRGGLF